jgi:hypothetical protein
MAALYSALANEIDDAVDCNGLALAVPPLGFTDVTRAESDLCSIGQRHLDLDDGILSTRSTHKPVD